MNINNGVKRWEVTAFIHTCGTKIETMKGSNKRKSFVDPAWGWIVPILKMTRFSCLLRLSYIIPPEMVVMYLKLSHTFSKQSYILQSIFASFEASIETLYSIIELTLYLCSFKAETVARASTEGKRSAVGKIKYGW